MYVKLGLKIPNRLGKKCQKNSGGIFLLTLYTFNKRLSTVLFLENRGFRRFEISNVFQFRKMLAVSVNITGNKIEK